MDIRREMEKQRNYLIKHRRYFHRYPELSHEEYKTQSYIEEELNGLGIQYKKVADTGIIATLGEGKSEDAIALRADMDALPITEVNEVSYASCHKGIMHACGHDCHLAMLLGAAKVLKEHEESLKGEVKLVFQPAEEKMAGAKELIKDEAYHNVSCIHGIHVWSELNKGEIAIKEGPLMAAVDAFKITIKGLSAHGAMPQKGVDAILIASHIVTNLQSIISRELSPLDPAVITVGKINGGTGINIIAEEVIIEGTIRYFNPNLKHKLKELMDRKIKHIAEGYGGIGQLNYIEGLPPVINDKDVIQVLKTSVEKIGCKSIAIEPVTISEDFSILMDSRRGAMTFIGIADENKKPLLHTNNFDVDEDILIDGAALHVQFIMDYIFDK
ncbi:M20 metallopeptidase family protein [Vallitalea okinawensis]|uniref:M20 metallopeptidase family protein n=1 Tax=Vallitalea okinawensis TaxID=2078660 RepID=UPI001300A09B|nr:amidohydrolase [Vallitalea okinawensis]